MRFWPVRPHSRACWLLPLLVLVGCATPDRAALFGGVADRVATETGAAAVWVRDQASRDAARQETAALLAEPLTEAAAIRLALLNHAGLRVDLEALEQARAQAVEAGMPANPTLSAAWLQVDDEDVTNLG